MAGGLKVAVVGVTGAVGKQLLAIIQQRQFPVRELVPFASARSEGRPITLNGKTYPCQVLKKEAFAGIQIAFFDASDVVSKEWVPQVAEAGAWVVDNSGYFRMEKDIPLLVPEINGQLLDSKLAGRPMLSARERILSGPNCSTVQLVMALKPIQDHWGIKRVVVSTYQSTSGAGTAAMDELTEQTAKVLSREPANPKVFAHQIAFNCIPHIGGFQTDNYTSEENKIMAESRKILNLPNLKITATAVRVPTLICHSESVNVECNRPVTPEQFREVLRDLPGIVLMDEPKQNLYPMNTTGGGEDPVYIGRIRKDDSIENGLNFWVVSDNLRKGAALNAVQIGEKLLKILA